MAAYPTQASFKSLSLPSVTPSGDGEGSITPVKNIPRRGKMGCLVELLGNVAILRGSNGSSFSCNRRHVKFVQTTKCPHDG